MQKRNNSVNNKYQLKKLDYTVVHGQIKQEKNF